MDISDFLWGTDPNRSSAAARIQIDAIRKMDPKSKEGLWFQNMVNYIYKARYATDHPISAEKAKSLAIYELGRWVDVYEEKEIRTLAERTAGVWPGMPTPPQHLWSDIRKKLEARDELTIMRWNGELGWDEVPRKPIPVVVDTQWDAKRDWEIYKQRWESAMQMVPQLLKNRRLFTDTERMLVDWPTVVNANLKAVEFEAEVSRLKATQTTVTETLNRIVKSILPNSDRIDDATQAANMTHNAVNGLKEAYANLEDTKLWIGRNDVTDAMLQNRVLGLTAENNRAIVEKNAANDTIVELRRQLAAGAHQQPAVGNAPQQQGAADLQRQLDAAIARCNAVEQDNVDIRQRLNVAERERDALRAAPAPQGGVNIDVLLQQKQDVETAKDAAILAMDTAQAEMRVLQDRLDAASEKNNATVQFTNDHITKLNVLMKDMKTLVASINSTTERGKNLLARIQATLSGITAQGETFKQGQGALRQPAVGNAPQQQGAANAVDLQQRLDAATEALRLVNAAKEEATRLKTDAETAKAAAETETARVQLALITANDRIRTAEAETDSERNAKTVVQDELDALRRQGVAQPIQQGAVDVATLQRQLDDATRRIESEELTNGRLRQMLTHAEEAEAEAKKETRRAELERAAAVQAKAGAVAEKNATNAELDAAMKDRAAAESRAEKQLAETDLVAQQLLAEIKTQVSENTESLFHRTKSAVDDEKSVVVDIIKAMIEWANKIGINVDENISEAKVDAMFKDLNSEYDTDMKEADQTVKDARDVYQLVTVITVLQQKVDSLRTRNSDSWLTSVATFIKDGIQKSKDKIEVLQHALEDARGAVGQVQSQAENDRKIAELELRLKTAERERDIVTSQLKTAKETIESNIITETDLKNRLTEISKSCDQRSFEIDRLTTELSAAKKENETMRNQMTRSAETAEKNLEAAKKEWQATTEREKATLVEENRDAKNQNLNMNAWIKDIAGDITNNTKTTPEENYNVSKRMIRKFKVLLSSIPVISEQHQPLELVIDTSIGFIMSQIREPLSGEQISIQTIIRVIDVELANLRRKLQISQADTSNLNKLIFKIPSK